MEKLFRYRSCSKNNIEAFEMDRLYFSVPNYFNDPYDSLLYIDKKRFNQNILNELQVGMDEYLEKLRLTKPKSYAFTKKPIMKNKMNDPKMKMKFLKEVNNITKKFKTDVIENLKVICFCKNGSSNSMWSYYADNHKGFTLLYDLEDLRKVECYNKKNGIVAGQKVQILKVNYGKVRIDVSPYLYNYMPEEMIAPSFRVDDYREISDNLLVKSFCTKATDYREEEEYRMLLKGVDLLKSNFADYIQCRPRAIILGNKITYENKNELIRIAREKSINVYRNSIDDTDNSYNFKKI